MTEKNFVTKIQIYSYTELSEEDKNLVNLAKEATKSSYAPYSKFHVGSALLLNNGVTIKGANQENAAFAGICGERSACYHAGAYYPGEPIKKIAIASFSHGDFVELPTAPCGVCRQALLEFETQANQPIEVLLVGKEIIYKVESVKALLPLAFTEF
ncbi:MAG: cytidine deaminase [Muribaculaceae bacterium]|nr:cytidine deaminase [Muribaculaceae bacterium]